MSYFLFLCPDLHLDAEEEVPELEHQIYFKRVRKLDVLNHKLMHLPVRKTMSAQTGVSASEVSQEVAKVRYKYNILLRGSYVLSTILCPKQ